MRNLGQNLLRFIQLQWQMQRAKLGLWREGLAPLWTVSILHCIKKVPEVSCSAHNWDLGLVEFLFHFFVSRYRNFERLHRHLKDIPNYTLHLPPKRIFSSSTEDSFVHQRCIQLDKYLQVLFSPLSAFLLLYVYFIVMLF